LIESADLLPRSDECVLLHVHRSQVMLYPAETLFSPLRATGKYGVSHQTRKYRLREVAPQ